MSVQEASARSLKLIIPVTGGEGEESFKRNGVVMHYTIVIPVGAPGGTTYDAEIFDSGAYGSSGRAGVVGNRSIKDNFRLDADDGTAHKFCISNASDDGDYVVKLWFER